MRLWELFWTAALLVAGASFALITVVVTFKGFHDLREWFGSLTRQNEAQKRQSDDAETP
ncbi:MAG: hypothetical protein M3458_24175 [Acidobacteriota bacterium]|nr:hypothetical protein [Pyrinomonadaceae bacterium]MDQ3253275.1 hypothetical protein [Acidobacteriota bacterium]MDQ3653322.1 hypothetical protein [Acidobacteriota bacterium]